MNKRGTMFYSDDQDGLARSGFSAYPLSIEAEGDSMALPATAYPGTTGNKRRNRRATTARGMSELALVAILTLIAAATKLYRIGRRNNVSWDEAHFGKFGAYYLNRTFYHDVHPPLAKMLVGLSELLAGHNGTFSFKGGHTYPPYVNYQFMRIFNAMFGIMLTPMAYLTCRQLRMPARYAAMAALFITFDNAICVMSRFILLDAPLLAFTALALMMLSYFHRQRHQPFSPQWTKHLCLLGVALGLVASSKWVGFFAISLVGFYTIFELYEMFCNTKMQPRLYAMHWMARVVGLIVIPFSVYALCFGIHLTVLDRYDGSANFMPVGFQVQLRGNPISQQPYDIQTGSQLRLFSKLAGSGYLHSHGHRYPTGSQRQQITGYGYPDQNNLWDIKRIKAAGDYKNANDVSATEQPISGYIGKGDLVRMHHNSTSTYLYMQGGVAAPVSNGYMEVSAVPADSAEATYPGTLWIVDIAKPTRRMNDGRIHPLGTPVRLRSLINDCVLVATGQKLDKNWGWGQAEMACDPQAAAKTKTSPNHLWTIERHVNQDLEKTNLSKYMRSSFWQNFGVLNRQMWITNNALIPDHDKHNVLESDPISWPTLQFPMRMVGWDDQSIKYLEVGNPLLWWASAWVCLVFPLQLMYWLARWRRQSLNWASGKFREYIEGALILWGGWALHYLPFFMMGRVTYLHHYLPALYFGILFLAYQIYHTSVWLKADQGQRVLYGSVFAALFGFWWFSPLTYGWSKPIRELRWVQWRESWPVYEDKYDM